MQRQKASATRLPALDEGTLQQLLGAAWVMQEHNDRLLAQQSATLPAEKDELLSEIVEIQKLIQSQQLDLRNACGLIAQGLQRMVRAEGTAIGCIQNGQIRYLAALGIAALNDNLLLPPESTLGHGVLRTGRLLQSPNPESDPRVPRDVCRKSGVKSLVLVPVFHDQRVKGVLELWFAVPRWLPEGELRLCQLMAGLVTEAMACAAQMESKRALFTERSAVLQALEQIKPQLERIAAPGEAHFPTSGQVKGPAESVLARNAESVPPRNNVVPFPVAASASETNSSANATDGTVNEIRETPINAIGAVCRGCGHNFAGNESFCGHCGITRHKETNLQSKWASLWYLQQAHQPQQADGEEEFPFAVPNFKSSELPISAEQFSDGSSSTLPPLVGPPSAASSPRYSSSKINDAELSSRLSRHLPTHDLPELAHNFMTAAPQEPMSTEIDRWQEPESAEIEDEGEIISRKLPRSLQSDSVLDEQDIVASNVATANDSDANTTSTATFVPSTSAAQASSRLQPVKEQSGKRDWFVEYRANIYLLVAAGLLLIVISGLGTGSSAHQNALRNRPSTQPKLTWMETMLVNMGLAVAPPAPDYADPGNPNTQVWLDIHTALYYCPGSELYGKTPGGRFATQQDAQQDQFEPALRQACN